MNKFFISFVIIASFLNSNLLAKLPLDKKVFIYNQLIESGNFSENQRFAMLNAINKKYNSIQEMKTPLLTKNEMTEMLSNLFDYSSSIQMMCLSIGTIQGINCPRETFLMAILKDDNSKSLVKASSNDIGVKGIIDSQLPLGFEKSDSYNNKGKYYIFDAILSQRLNKNTAIFFTNGLYFILEIPEGNYSEGTRYIGIVKGEGSYRYISQQISKGTALSIHNQ